MATSIIRTISAFFAQIMRIHYETKRKKEI